MRLDKIEVKCYSGYTYAERPISFIIQGKDYQIESIEKEWREPGERWFLVITGDNKYFKLCYNEAHDEWLVFKRDYQR